MTLPKGELGFSDAFLISEPETASELPSGNHRVELLIAEASLDARVAAARVRFSDQPPTSWRRLGWIGVDSGSAAFFDPRVPPSIADADVDVFIADLTRALEAASRSTYSIAALNWKGMTFVAFSSGFGDGTYPVFLGTSAAGAPAAVVVDFEVLPWPAPAGAEELDR